MVCQRRRRDGPSVPPLRRTLEQFCRLPVQLLLILPDAQGGGGNVGHRLWIEFFQQRQQLVPHPVAGIGLVGVGLILHMRYAALVQIGADLPWAHRQHGTDDVSPPLRDAGQPL